MCQPGAVRVDPFINLVVTGDLNAFEFTDGYVDVTGHMKGSVVPSDNLICGTNPCPDVVEPDLVNQVLTIPASERYSFIFRGNAQTLDHALTSSGLDELVTDFNFGRGNADAAVDLPYDIFDTAGCSCEQIIEEKHRGHGHSAEEMLKKIKYGCSDGEMKK